MLKSQSRSQPQLGKVKNKKSQYIHAFVISAGLSIIAIAVLTILGDLFKPLKNWLANTFYHHWVGKGVISFVGFYIVGYILSFLVSDNRDREATMLLWLFWVSLLSALAIFGFYYYETFLVAHA